MLLLEREIHQGGEKGGEKDGEEKLYEGEVEERRRKGTEVLQSRTCVAVRNAKVRRVARGKKERRRKKRSGDLGRPEVLDNDVVAVVCASCARDMSVPWLRGREGEGGEAFADRRRACSCARND